MLQVNIVVCFGIACTISAKVISLNRSNKCEIPSPSIYEELGCVAMYYQLGDHCPVRYQCPNLEEQGSDKCYYRGQIYDVGDNLNAEDDCLASCICHKKSIEAPAAFHCADFECPEDVDDDLAPKEGCTFSYTLGKCCATGQICKADESTLHRCEHIGQVVGVTGQRFYPRDNPCYSCLCDENWQNNVTLLNQPTISENCHRLTCSTELEYRDKLLAKCAPVYSRPNACCPTDWICPYDLPAIEVLNTPSFAPDDSRPECEFGNVKVRKYDAINTFINNRTCRCDVPPFMTCYQNAKC